MQVGIIATGAPDLGWSPEVRQTIANWRIIPRPVNIAIMAAVGLAFEEVARGPRRKLANRAAISKTC
jgi:hypothetical protein